MWTSITNESEVVMASNFCKLCLEFHPLCNSHALPRSIFNYILRKNSGKTISVTDDKETPVQFSSDSWDAEILCANCERKMNEKYDDYGIAVFRGHEGAVMPEATGMRFLRIDRKRLRMFFLSVLWRMSVSTHPNYSNINLPYSWEDDLRSALHFGISIPQSRYTVFLCKMRDSTPHHGFRNEDIRGLICAPFGRRYESMTSVSFPFLGFFVEVFFPKVLKPFSKREGVLHGRSPVFLAPYFELLDIPEIMQLLVTGLEKHTIGLSRLP